MSKFYSYNVKQIVRDPAFFSKEEKISKLRSIESQARDLQRAAAGNINDGVVTLSENGCADVGGGKFRRLFHSAMACRR